MDDVYLTTEQAEEVVMAVEVGMYEIDYPGNRSKLAHARLLLAECREGKMAKLLDKIGEGKNVLQ